MNRRLWIFFIGAGCTVLMAATFALRFGALHVPLSTILHDLFLSGGNLDEVAIRSLRVPRVILAAVVGAALAGSGALLQGITRNPLGSPDLFGLLSGTECGAVVALYVFGSHSEAVATLTGMAGGALALGLVFAVARLSRQSHSVIAVAVAGFSIGILVDGVTGLLIKWRETQYESINRWAEGSIGGRDPAITRAIIPVVLLAFIVGMFCARQLNVVNLGDEAAIGLGLRTNHLRLVVFGAVLALTASSVTAAGPIAFIGLIAPHIARAFTGPDYRFVIPGAALVGSATLILADLCARTILAGVFDELPIAALTTAVGAPALLFILRRQMRTP